MTSGLFLFTCYRMPLTDDVARICIAKVEGCNLVNKCEECKKEVAKLIEADDMFADYFEQLEYLKKKLANKKNETA